MLMKLAQTQALAPAAAPSATAAPTADAPAPAAGVPVAMPGAPISLAAAAAPATKEPRGKERRLIEHARKTAQKAASAAGSAKKLTAQQAAAAAKKAQQAAQAAHGAAANAARVAQQREQQQQQLAQQQQLFAQQQQQHYQQQQQQQQQRAMAAASMPDFAASLGLPVVAPPAVISGYGSPTKHAFVTAHAGARAGASCAHVNPLRSPEDDHSFLFNAVDSVLEVNRAVTGTPAAVKTARKVGKPVTMPGMSGTATTTPTSTMFMGQDVGSMGSPMSISGTPADAGAGAGAGAGASTAVEGEVVLDVGCMNALAPCAFLPPADALEVG